MSDSQFKFRTAYVPHNSGHDLTALMELCQEIKFCSTGYEVEGTLEAVIEKSLVDFDPEKDVVVPVGNVASNLLVGACLARKCMRWEDAEYNVALVTQFHVAIYRDKVYTVREIRLGAADAPSN